MTRIGDIVISIHFFLILMMNIISTVCEITSCGLILNVFFLEFQSRFHLDFSM